MPRSLLLGTVALFATVLWPVFPALAQTDDCAAAAETADGHYQRGRFDDALATLQPCLDDPSLDDETRLQLLRLAAFNYLAKDLNEDAEQAVEQLLTLNPSYEVNILEDPPPFIRMVGEVREAMSAADTPSVVVRNDPDPPPPQPVVTPQTSGGPKLGRWILLGGGLVAGGVLAAVLLTSETPVDPISPPPALPPGN